jgi:GEVED domain/Secretion system C-terminal sorting domain/SprB repeat
MKKLSLLLIALFAFALNHIQAQIVLSVDSVVNVSNCNVGHIYCSASNTTGSPYNFSMVGSALITNGHFIVTTAGTYTIIVNDSLGYSDTASVVVTGSNQAMAITLAGSNNNNCNLTCDTTIINVSGGTPPYTYLGTQGMIQWSNKFIVCNLTTSGVYTFTVTDANNCQATVTKLIQAASVSMGFSNTITHATCSNNNGSIALVIIGGVPPITTTVNGVATPAIVSNLAAGVYTIVATSATGCTISNLVTISNTTSLNTSFTKTNTTCSTANGAITANVLNNSGTPPYSYLWSTGDTTKTIIGLAQGNYTCTITDHLGCSKTSSTSLTNSSSITLTPTLTHPKCNGTLGGIKIKPSSGTAPYTFLWNNGATSDSIFGLIAGNYTCTVTDNTGCTKSVINVLTLVNTIALSLTGTNSSCTNNGAITAIVSGGVSPYTFAINGGTSSVSNIFNNLLQGTYTCVATDAAGCSKSAIKTITSINTVILNLISLQNSCNGNNGALHVVASNGKAPYTYLWNTMPVQSTDSVYGLANGIYNVVVTDSNGCSRTDSFIIQTINMNATVSAASICSGDTTSINVSIQNSNSAIPQGYAPSGAANIMDEDIVSVQLGSFIQTSSCSTSNGAVNAIGFAPSVLNLYSNYTNIVAGNFPAGAIIPYTLKFGQCNTGSFSAGYSIYIDVNRNGTLEATEKFAGSTATILIPVGANFTTISGNITLPVNITPGSTLLRVILNELSATPLANGIYVYGETEDYKIILGNVLNNQSTFYPSASVISVTGNKAIVAPTATTIYTIVNTDPQVCNDTTYATVVVNNNLANNTVTTLASAVDCPLSTNGQIAVVTTPVSNSLVYSWSNGDSANIASNLPIGNYKVTVYDSNGGCQVLMDTIKSLGINCGNIGGIVKHDANDNCIAEVSETPIPNTMITANPGNHITYSDATGHYSFAGLPYSTYTITHGNNLPSFVNNCAPIVTSIIDSTNFAASVDFADSNKLVFDYKIYSTNGCVAPALGQTKRKIYVNHNQLNITAGANVYVVFDSIQLYKSSVPTHSNINGDTVFWNLNVTGGYSYLTNGGLINLELKIDSATQMGVLYHLKMGLYNTQYVDAVLWNNKHTYTVTTCTSYDPNDKSVTPMGETTLGYIPTTENQMDYIINFQNTGNFTAGRVIIMDTLSANVDITNFQVIGASHLYQLQVIDNHILKFAFLNIMLPDSGTNFEGSKGHVAFTIKHNNNLVAGNSISNQAAIYFDFNAPVLTNYVINTLYDAMASHNNTTNNSMCNATCGNGAATVINTGGVQPYTNTITPMCAATIVNGNQISNLPSGNFVITSTDAIGNVISNTTVINNSPSNINIASASITQPAAGVWGSVTVNPASGVGAYTYLWTPGNMTTATANNLAPGTYTCVVADANGCTASAVYTINVPLNINGITRPNVKVYPNPTSGNLIIENDAPIGHIRITNAIGVVVKELDTQKSAITLDVSSFANGIYEIKTEHGIITKFVKQN